MPRFRYRSQMERFRCRSSMLITDADHKCCQQTSPAYTAVWRKVMRKAYAAAVSANRHSSKRYSNSKLLPPMSRSLASAVTRCCSLMPVANLKNRCRFQMPFPDAGGKSRKQIRRAEPKRARNKCVNLQSHFFHLFLFSL